MTGPAPPGYLAGLFRSLQGEGPWAGRPEVFLRLAGCSVGCPWCDTRDAWERPPSFPVAGGEAEPNPVEADRAVRLAKEAARPSCKWISFTGGEPLEQGPFLRALLPLLRGEGFFLHLETAGVHPGPLESLLPFLDQVSMDWKLPSLGGRDFRQAHKACLRVLSSWEGGKAVKIVVGASCPPSEAEEALGEALGICPDARPVLQPLTAPASAEPEPGALDLCLALAWKWGERAPSLRVLPQVHKLLGLP